MRFLILFPLFLAGRPAFAAPASCTWNASHTYFSCGAFNSGAISGASAPTLSDAIEQNPAALPIVPTPFELEGTYVSRASPGGSPKVTATSLLGLKGLGLAAGSWNDGSFASPDLDNHFRGTALETLYRVSAPSSTGGRLGAALGWPQKLLPKGYSLSGGASAGFGSGASYFAPQLGLQAVLLGNLAIGYAYGYEKVSPSIPRVDTSSFTFGTQLFGLHVGLAYQTLKSTGYETTATSLSGSYNSDAFAVWLAQKWETNQLKKTATWGRFGLQWRASSRIGVNYEYGMYKYASGVSVQVNL